MNNMYPGKLALFNYLFGDLVRYLFSKKISFGNFLLIPLWLFIYFYVFKYHKKGTKYNWKEWFYIIISIVGTVGMIIFQVILIVDFDKFHW